MYKLANVQTHKRTCTHNLVICLHVVVLVMREFMYVIWDQHACKVTYKERLMCYCTSVLYILTRAYIQYIHMYVHICNIQFMYGVYVVLYI